MRFLLILTVIVGFSALLLLFLVQNPSVSNVSDDREDLKEVVYSSTVCSNHWRVELFEMWDNKTHDYTNDPIYQECSEWLEFEKYANTSYDPSPVQLEAILEHCIDSKDLVETKGLSYSNDTHYIDTVNCQWQALGRIGNMKPNSR